VESLAFSVFDASNAFPKTFWPGVGQNCHMSFPSSSSSPSSPSSSSSNRLQQLNVKPINVEPWRAGHHQEKQQDVKQISLYVEHGPLLFGAKFCPTSV